MFVKCVNLWMWKPILGPVRRDLNNYLFGGWNHHKRGSMKLIGSTLTCGSSSTPFERKFVVHAFIPPPLIHYHVYKLSHVNNSKLIIYVYSKLGELAIIISLILHHNKVTYSNELMPYLLVTQFPRLKPLNTLFLHHISVQRLV